MLHILKVSSDGTLCLELMTLSVKALAYDTLTYLMLHLETLNALSYKRCPRLAWVTSTHLINGIFVLFCDLNAHSQGLNPGSQDYNSTALPLSYLPLTHLVSGNRA